jgi:hypothetical protein
MITRKLVGSIVVLGLSITSSQILSEYSVAHDGTVPEQLKPAGQSTSNLGDAPKLTLQEIDEWIAKNVPTLPRTRSELLAIDEDYRIVVYNRLTPETKADIWQDKIAHTLRSRTWTPKQSSILIDLLAMATPETFGNPDEDRVEFKAWSRDWSSRARNEFSFKEIRAITKGFADLPGDTKALDVGSNKSRALIPYCNCRYDEECQGGYYTALGCTGDCVPYPRCGIFYNATCTQWGVECGT